MRGEVRVVERVPEAFAAVVRGERPDVIALSGGSTARACYERLAAAGGLDWPGVEVVIGDERFVAVDDPDSNEGLVRRTLLGGRDDVRVHSARGSAPTPVEAAAAYDAVVAGLPPIGLVHLGLGADGHTASLFPGGPELEERDRLVVSSASPEHPHPRITLTLPAIARSRLVVFTVEGEGKREAFARVRDGADLPAARVEADRMLWLVDPAAAGRVAGRAGGRSPDSAGG